MAALMVILFLFLPKGIVLVSAELILFVVLVWMLSFFRDPRREIPFNENTLLSPADGTITDICEVEDQDLGGKALRIGMFLSIFNVHLNRMPCSARVESVRYKEGQFINAMSAESGRINESNEIVITRLAEPRERLLVRQVSGAIARRIVCKAEPGQEYAQGFAFGMIKFGSRTELYLPCAEGSYDVMVKIGDKVRAGLSPLIVYKP
jgi:phosphatidylserine decarboxylase